MISTNTAAPAILLTTLPIITGVEVVSLFLELELPLSAVVVADAPEPVPLAPAITPPASVDVAPAQDSNE